MKKSRLSTLAATGVLAGVLAVHLGCIAMPDVKQDLKWEWPAGRPVSTKLLVRVDAIKKAGGGLFGFGKAPSPSTAGFLPDAHSVEATVLAGPEAVVGRALRFDLPGPEAARLKSGASAGLGLVDGGRILVCVAGAPPGDAAAQAGWLAQWSCPAD